MLFVYVNTNPVVFSIIYMLLDSINPYFYRRQSIFLNVALFWGRGGAEGIKSMECALLLHRKTLQPTFLFIHILEMLLLYFTYVSQLHALIIIRIQIKMQEITQTVVMV
jgi:hypothetical protein